PFCEEGTLLSYVQKKGSSFKPEDLVELLQIFEDILVGLQAMHAKQLVHGDLKLENILLTRDKDGRLRARITDFGLTLDLKLRKSNPAQFEKDNFFVDAQYGTPGHTSYELDKLRAPIGKRKPLPDNFNYLATDMWSLGVMLKVALDGGKNPSWVPPLQ